jgi:hypothetical protein
MYIAWRPIPAEDPMMVKGKLLTVVIFGCEVTKLNSVRRIGVRYHSQGDEEVVPF